MPQATPGATHGGMGDLRKWVGWLARQDVGDASMSFTLCRQAMHVGRVFVARA